MNSAEKFTVAKIELQFLIEMVKNHQKNIKKWSRNCLERSKIY